MISELPSIYYEKELKDYLLLKGYKANNILNIREKDNKFVYNFLYPIYSIITKKEELNEEYDLIIDYLIRNYYMILKGFGYLISTYLAERIHELKDENVKDKMIYVSNNLNQLDIDEIIDLFNIKIGKKLTKKK